MTPLRLIVADDHPVVRTGLQGMLNSQPDFEVVAEADTGTKAVSLTLQLRPDVVLMDLRMPELDGVAAIRQIKAQRPECHVLVLTTYDSDSDILSAVEAGATGYLLKDTPRDELFRAIRATAHGETVFAPPVASRLVAYRESPSEETLSAREVEVLVLASRGASNKEIARRLFISEATVKSHLIHIFDKLKVSDRTAAVRIALERGILQL
jgi:DNA-binding NarL/FixJ family response regulator